MPTWLNEGLATYAEGSLSPDLQSALDQAISSDSLMTLRSLSRSFPAARGGDSLSYAQSRSLVAYLIDAHGWEKIRELLAVFQEAPLTMTHYCGFTELTWTLWNRSGINI